DVCSSDLLFRVTIVSLLLDRYPLASTRLPICFCPLNSAGEKVVTGTSVPGHGPPRCHTVNREPANPCDRTAWDTAPCPAGRHGADRKSVVHGGRRLRGGRPRGARS